MSLGTIRGPVMDPKLEKDRVRLRAALSLIRDSTRCPTYEELVLLDMNPLPPPALNLNLAGPAREAAVNMITEAILGRMPADEAKANPANAVQASSAGDAHRIGPESPAELSA